MKVATFLLEYFELFLEVFHLRLLLLVNLVTAVAFTVLLWLLTHSTMYLIIQRST